MLDVFKYLSGILRGWEWGRGEVDFRRPKCCNDSPSDSSPVARIVGGFSGILVTSEEKKIFNFRFYIILPYFVKFFFFQFLDFYFLYFMILFIL